MQLWHPQQLAMLHSSDGLCTDGTIILSTAHTVQYVVARRDSLQTIQLMLQAA